MMVVVGGNGGDEGEVGAYASPDLGLALMQSLICLTSRLPDRMTQHNLSTPYVCIFF